MHRILLIDDEKNIMLALKRSIRLSFPDSAINVEICDTQQYAIDQLGLSAYACIISDYNMPGMDGINLLRIAKVIQPETIRIMLSASADFETIRAAVNEAEVFRYLTKPWQNDELRNVLQGAFDKYAIYESERLAALEQSLTPQEREARRLEKIEPGITHVEWSPLGGVLPPN